MPFSYNVDPIETVFSHPGCLLAFAYVAFAVVCVMRQAP